MKRIRATITALTLIVTTFSAGCGDLGSFVYFLLPEQKIPAEVKHLGTQEKGKEVRAMVLVRSQFDTRMKFISADRELALAFHKELKEMCAYNEDKLTLIAPEKVEAFKSSRPNWDQLNPIDVGRHFQADYVILLEINNLSLYEPGSHKMFYRGNVSLSVKLVDVNHPDESPARREFNCTYPSEAKIVEADTSTPEQVFRERFLKYVSKRVSWMFEPHPLRDSHLVD